MKVSFPLVKGGSGSDIFTLNLAYGLQAAEIDVNIQHINPLQGIFPPLSGLGYNPGDANITHANSWNGFAFKGDIPLVVTEYHVVHDSILEPYKTFSQKAYHRLMFKCEEKSFAMAEDVTCISRYTQKMLEKTFGYSGSKMIYCGIDTNKFRPIQVSKEQYGIEESKSLLLFVGNLSRRKGADLLIPIMNRLGDQYVLLTTTGMRNSGSLRHGNIISLGKLTLLKLIDAYNLCDMFLFPSRLEGFGLSVAEAMACGKPVITTNASSLPELVEQDKGGILCEMDNINEFVDSVKYLANDENSRRRMGNYNRQVVLERFQVKKMVANYRHIYRSI